MNNRRGGCILLVACLLFLIPVSGWAQSGGSAALSSLDSQEFPKMEAFLDVRDSQGHFVHGLTPDDLEMLENNRPAPVAALQELRPGVQLAVAFNPGPTFAVRNSQGAARYDFLKDALAEWTRSRTASTLDDLSLVSLNGAMVRHSHNLAAWLEGLQAMPEDVRSAVPSMEPLLTAMDLVTDATPRPGMNRAVLWITAPLDNRMSVSLENVKARAEQQGVRIFIWLVVPVGAPVTEPQLRMENLAASTGGELFSFSGDETIPDLESYLESLRSIYRVEYTSRLNTSGDHRLAMRVRTRAGETLTSEPLTFELEIAPPEPIFVSPELEIIRTPPDNLPSREVLEELPVEYYLPHEHPLHLVLDFPDGRVRPIVKTRLYVDGILAAENVAPPFERFTWDLSHYAESGRHSLRVEVEDALGLSGSSIETFILVKVEHPQRTWWTGLTRHIPSLAVLLVLVSGSVLLLVLVVGGRIQPRVHRLGRRSGGGKRPKPIPEAPAAREKEESMARHLPGWVNRLHWPQRHVSPQAYAFLTPISENNVHVTAAPVPITVEEMTLGSDARLATLVIEDPSIAGLHARLLRQPNGSFRIQDEGSIAGTWINYCPINHTGVSLEHGDILHIGRSGYRFTLRQPAQVRKPVLVLVQPPEEVSS
jgi:hypothetical protein